MIGTTLKLALARAFLIGLSAAGLSLTTPLGYGSAMGTAAAAEPATLRMNVAWPAKSSEMLTVRRFVELLGERTQGRLKIDPHPACALAACDKALAELAKGAVDLDAGTLSVADAATIPAAALLVAPVPGLKGNHVHALWLENAGFRELVERAYAEKNVRILAVWSAGDAGLATTDRVQTADALVGQTIRPLGGELAAKVLQAIGVKLAPPSAAARDRNVTGSATSIEGLLGSDYLAVSKYWQPWFLGAQVNRIAINEDQWKKLPEPIQLALKQTAAEVARSGQETGVTTQGGLLAQVLMDHKVSFIPVKESEIEKLRQKAEPAVRDYARSHPGSAGGTERLLEVLLKEGTKPLKVQAPSAKEAPIAAPTRVVAAKPSSAITWRMGVLESPTDNNAIAMQRFAQEVAERTKGGIQITVFPACTLIKCTDALKELGRGTVSIDQNNTAVADEGTLPAAGILTPPFLGVGASLIHGLFVDNREYRDVVNQMYGSVNVKVLSMWNAGDGGFVSLNPLLTVDDFKGRIVRPSASKIAAAILHQVNSETALMSGAEAVQAMRQRIINVSVIEPSALISRGYSDFAKYWQPWKPWAINDRIAVNAETWKGLSSEYQQILEETALQVAAMINQVSEASQGAFMFKNLVENQMEFLAVAEAELDKMRRIAEKVVRESVSAGGAHQKAMGQILDMYLARVGRR